MCPGVVRSYSRRPPGLRRPVLYHNSIALRLAFDDGPPNGSPACGRPQAGAGKNIDGSTDTSCDISTGTTGDSPTRDITIPLEALPEGQPLPDSNDPLELIRPFQKRFEMLSELTDIPLQNLVARAVTLMNTLKPRDEWNKHAEEKFRGWMKAAHLEISFVRPRVAVALRAFGQVLTELADAQFLDERPLSFLQNFTRLHDPTLSLLTPIPRPPEIIAPNGEEMGPYPRKDWVNSGAEAFPLVLDVLSDERIVLGELSRFVNLD